MNRYFLFVLIAIYSTVVSAEKTNSESAQALANTMRLTLISPGFMTHMLVTNIDQTGQPSRPIKLAFIGQFGLKEQRLIVKTIASGTHNMRSFYAKRGDDGTILAVETSTVNHAPLVEIDPYRKLLDTNLTLWDLFGEWWVWSKQIQGKTEILLGRSCSVVRSVSDSEQSPIHEVVSCVDPLAHIALRTQFFDHQRTLIRTIYVEQIGRTEDGRVIARKISITNSDRSVTSVELYSGDEHYPVTNDTFSEFNQGVDSRKSKIDVLL